VSGNRTLYQCLHAKVKDGSITCAKGHGFPVQGHKGMSKGIPIARLAAGDLLECTACVGCSDYDRMGPTPKKKERGWL
jgi:hypothetical protein